MGTFDDSYRSRLAVLSRKLKVHVSGGQNDVAILTAFGRKRALISPNFCQSERPLSEKADIGLILTKGAANDPKRTFPLRMHLPNRRHNFDWWLFFAARESSPGVIRCFCRQCGSSLWSMGGGQKLSWVSLGTITGDPKLRPEAHIFVGSKAPWYEITDDLPQFDEWPPVTSEFFQRFD